MSKDSFAYIEQRLQESASPGIRPGLARLSRLMSLIGNPERRFRAVHIVGTNGKGSTAASLASILRESNYKTAMYTSPHLVSFGERLEINGARVSQEKWLYFTEKMIKAAEECELLKGDRPTYFELTTAVAFMIIADEDVDIAVIEAGLGGRLDATNILGNVALTLITPIGMDHTEYLGESLLSIAKEKFAVMRPGTPAIFAGGEPETEDAFFRHAGKTGAPAQLLRRLCSHGVIQVSLAGTDFYIESECMRSEYHTPLIGTFQADNAALAVTAACALRNLKENPFNGIDFPALYNGIVNTSWPGRFELVKKSPALLLDGAHNPHALTRLLETLSAIERNRPFNIVLAMMKDKDVHKSLELLKPLDTVVYCTRVPDMERSMTEEELFTLAEEAGLKTAGRYSDPMAAVKESLSTGADTVCCGSLYLVGYVKGHGNEF